MNRRLQDKKDAGGVIYSLHIELILIKICVSIETFINIFLGDAMTKITIQDLLKRINYIEADIDIQKQILFSIPSNQQSEMEKTIGIIAAKKKEIEDLRQQIQDMDPEEHARIVAFEKAVAEFKELATATKFTSVTGRNINEQCVLVLQDGSEVECLVKACDDNGDWTIITLDGDLKQFAKSAVAEVPAPSPIH